jgi:hypothetical protein
MSPDPFILALDCCNSALVRQIPPLKDKRGQVYFLHAWDDPAWSAALPSSSHAVRASPRSEQPSSRTDRSLPENSVRQPDSDQSVRSIDERLPSQSRLCAGAGRFGARSAVAAWEDGGSAVLQVVPAAIDRFGRLTNDCRGKVVCVREIAGFGNARVLAGERSASAGW